MLPLTMHTWATRLHSTYLSKYYSPPLLNLLIKMENLTFLGSRRSPLSFVVTSLTAALRTGQWTSSLLNKLWCDPRSTICPDPNIFHVHVYNITFERLLHDYDFSFFKSLSSALFVFLSHIKTAANLYKCIYMIKFLIVTAAYIM